MNVPQLKRIRVSSLREVQTWLVKNKSWPDEVMLVTYNQKSAGESVSREELEIVVVEHGWALGRSYTLNRDLVGHVIAQDQ